MHQSIPIVKGSRTMSPQLLIASLIVAGVATLRWLSHQQPHAEAPAPVDDMFDYTMYDDPC
jgi:hypothetical protein